MFKKKFNPYNNLNEAVEDLRLAPQIDLTSGKTSMEEAKDFCKYVLTVIGRLGVTDLSTVDSIKSSALIPEELQKLGCVSWDEAHSSYRHDGNLDELSVSKDISLPLSVFTQLVDPKNPDTYHFCMNYIYDDNFENSWVGRWLRSNGVKDPNKYQEQRKKELLHAREDSEEVME